MTRAECRTSETITGNDAAVRRVGSALLSGYTAACRIYTPLPDARLYDPNDYQTNPDALDDYYKQLEEMGITLLRSSRQHQ